MMRPGTKANVRECFRESGAYPGANEESTISASLVPSAYKDFDIDAEAYDVMRPGLGQKKWMRPPAYTVDEETRVMTRVGKYVFVPREFLKCGLRFPLHEFVRQVIDEMGCGVGQISPNLFAVISDYLAHCRRQGVAPSLKIFFNMYRPLKIPRRKGLLHFREAG